MNGRPSKILIIKPGAIGDLLHLSPTVRAIKQRFPEARITIVVGSPSCIGLFSHNPLIEKVLVFDRKGEHRSWSAFLKLCREIRSGGFDLVINFQRSNLKTWLLTLAASPCRVLVYHKSRKRTVHAVVNHLETLAPLGIDPLEQELSLEMYIGEEDELFAEKLFVAEGIQGRTTVALNLGASNRIKCWSPQSFAQLGNRLQSECHAAVLLVGGPDEHDLAAEVCAGMSSPPVNTVGRISLTQLGGVLKRCSVLVSGDTGPLHLATAVGTRVIALFGAIDPERTGPVGSGHLVISHRELGCVPCNAKKCDNVNQLECMELISVDEVFAAVRKLLYGNGATDLQDDNPGEKTISDAHPDC